ncbi:MAG: SoxR reducing system RseC family protein [Candidatus Omnitrophica bacterium]|nr:SoxR reducing system RseC family protein [Candidatus Omnitrophota bacterium]
MFKETVEVVEAWEDKVKIKFTKKEMCSCCKLSHICGMGKEKLTIDACGFVLEAGDRIEVGIEEKKTLLASVIMFLAPGALFMLSLIVFKKQGEFLSFLLALLMLCIYYGGMKLLLKNWAKKFHLKILKKIQN